ncbi:hypothetical protein A8C56_00475 [Niabella ginsenosidivorans]|uniref:Uncharacterized protein n=1 Tax=Niabella ginsenosidivorans TaxID=1176587 RepID=A0A1A9HXV1_9BACT|nr:hypothetical protein A8C56_00475 [Niabella ginsenosidivorans]
MEGYAGITEGNVEYKMRNIKRVAFIPGKAVDQVKCCAATLPIFGTSLRAIFGLIKKFPTKTQPFLLGCKESCLHVMFRCSEPSERSLPPIAEAQMGNYQRY